MPPFRPIRYLDHLLSAHLIHDILVNITDLPLVGVLQHTLDLGKHFLSGHGLLAHNFAPPQLFLLTPPAPFAILAVSINILFNIPGFPGC